MQTIPQPIIQVEGITLERRDDGTKRIPGPRFTLGMLAYILEHYEIQEIIVRPKAA